MAARITIEEMEEEPQTVITWESVPLTAPQNATAAGYNYYVSALPFVLIINFSKSDNKTRSTTLPI